MRILRWVLWVSLKDKKRNEVIRKYAGDGQHYYQNTKGQIEMVWSCDEKRGRRLHEKNYDSRGQRTPQSRTTEEAMGRHDTTKHEVSPIEERRYWWQKDDAGMTDPGGWPLPLEGLIRYKDSRCLIEGIWRKNYSRWHTTTIILLVVDEDA